MEAVAGWLPEFQHGAGARPARSRRDEHVGEELPADEPTVLWQ